MPTPTMAEERLNRMAVDLKPDPTPPRAAQPVRYYGRVQLDPQRVTKEMDVVVEEVIQRLTELVGCEVEITVEISARSRMGLMRGLCVR